MQCLVQKKPMMCTQSKGSVTAANHTSLAEQMQRDESLWEPWRGNTEATKASQKRLEITVHTMRMIHRTCITTEVTNSPKITLRNKNYKFCFKHKHDISFG